MNDSFFSQGCTSYKDCDIVRSLLSKGAREHLTDSLCPLCLFGQVLNENNACSSTDIVKTNDEGHHAL